MILSWLKVSAIVVSLGLLTACSGGGGSASKLANANQGAEEPTPPRKQQTITYQAVDLAAISDINLRSCIVESGATITNVHNLNCTRRGIQSLKGIEQFEDLRTLTLSNNQLTDISELALLSNLSYLDIRNNQISSLDALQTLKFLDVLMAERNQLRSIDALSGSSVSRLYVSDNKINSLNVLTNLPRLKNLTAENNQAPLPNKMPSSLETFRI